MRASPIRIATVTLGALLLAGAAAPAASAAAAPGPEGPAPSAGCGQVPPQPPGTSEARTITSGDRERSYRLHLPEGYDAARPWPVVLAFHGRGNTGAGTEAFSGLSTLPAVVAYPEGVPGVGDDRQAWQGAPYAAPGVDDVAFTGDLLDRLGNDLCVDRSRVYATGKSNGAGFAALLACRASDRIAAIAPVAAALYPDTRTPCAPGRPVPVIDFHGTVDATIPYAGDAGRGLPAIPDRVADRARRNGCATEPKRSRIEPDITVTRYRDCDGGNEVQHLAVDDGGHTWPGADTYSGGGYATQTIEAHEVMWRFLRRFQLPGSTEGTS